VKRVAVVGVSGSGKSTFASALSARTGLPLVELDALYWGPNWTPREHSDFRAAVARAVAGNAWITDGNYSSARDLVWSAADTLVWLDFGLPLILWRLLRRSFLRWSRRELLWGNNRERLWTHFVRRDSLFLWAVQTYPRYRRLYPALLNEASYQHLVLVRLHSPAEARRWLTLRSLV
jgi:adenylate kinase family enzyme